MGCSNSNVKNKLTSNNIQERYEFVPNLNNNSIKKRKYKNRTFNPDSFYNFTEEEISLILSLEKSVSDKNDNYILLYHKFDVDYTYPGLKTIKTIVCHEYLVCYVRPDYNGTFTYFSPLKGFCIESGVLDYCMIKGKRVPAQMTLLEDGRVYISLQINEINKDDNYKDLIVFEFHYIFKQINSFGMRVIDICCEKEPDTCSIYLKYDKNEFIIQKYVPNLVIRQRNGKFNIFNQPIFRLGLIDNERKLSVDNLDSKYKEILKSKLDNQQIETLDKIFEKIILEPLENNLLFYKCHHKIQSNTDKVTGLMVIIRPHFSSSYFRITSNEDCSPNIVDFTILNMKVNGKELLKISENEKANCEKNYYLTSKYKYEYDIECKDNIIILEFTMICNNRSQDKIKYSMDPRQFLQINF